MTVSTRVDWADDGTYSGRDLDDRRFSVQLAHGSDLSQSSIAIPASLPSGRIVTLATPGTDPDAATGALSAATLRAPHRARILIGGAVHWDGIVQYSSRQVTAGITRLTWELSSADAETLRSRIAFDFDGGTPAAIADAISEALGVTVETSATGPPMGQIQFRGTALALIEALARWCWALPLQDSDGAWQLLPWSAIPPPTTTLNRSWQPLDGRSVQIAPRMIRDAAVMQATLLSASESTTLAETEVSLRSGTQRDVTLTASSQLVVDSWTSVASSDTTDVQVISTSIAVSPNGRSATVRVAATSKTPAETVTVTLTATGTARRKTGDTSRQVAFEQHPTRPAALPPWAAESFAGAGSDVLAGLRARAEGPRIARVAFPLRQSSQRLATLAQLAPSSLVRFSQMFGTTIDTALVATEVAAGEAADIGLLTVTGISPQFTRLPALVVQATDQGPTTTLMTVSVTVPSASSTLYGRYRPRSQSRWTAIPTQPADLDTLGVWLTGLTANTDYEAEFSLNADFSAAESIDWTTLDGASAADLTSMSWWQFNKMAGQAGTGSATLAQILAIAPQTIQTGGTAGITSMSVRSVDVLRPLRIYRQGFYGTEYRVGGTIVADNAQATIRLESFRSSRGAWQDPITGTGTLTFVRSLLGPFTVGGTQWLPLRITVSQVGRPTTEHILAWSRTV